MKDLRTFFQQCAAKSLFQLIVLYLRDALKIIIFQNVLQSLTESQS